jgi:acyl-coenzyme A thioesterase PaaI-like protein
VTYEFDRATATAPLGAGRYGATVIDGWDIRGVPNGGYVLATAARAMAHACDRPDPVAVNGRFLQMTSPGEIEIVTEVLRSGKHHATVRGTVRQSDRITVEMLGTFSDLSGAPADSPLGPAPPDLGAPGDGYSSAMASSEVFEPPLISERVELRIHPDSVGFGLGRPTGAGLMRAWARFADGRPPDPLAIVLFVDALPPAVFNTDVKPSWTPTVELTVHCLRRPAPDWLAIETRVGAIVGAYLTEDATVWDAQGRIVAVGRQLAMMPRG